MNTSDVILLSFANNEENDLSFLKDEVDGAYDKLFNLKDKSIIEVIKEESITADDVLTNFMERYQNRIVIFHFGGHASGDTLLLDDRPVFAQGLAGFLGRQENLKLVFLNACNTLEPAEAYLEAGVRALIATTLPVADGLACLFAVTFYTALSKNETIQVAYQYAVDAIRLRYEKYKSIEAITLEYRTINKEALHKSIVNPWQLIVQDNGILNWKISKCNEIMRLLKTGSGRYYEHLRNGRYKYLKISDMLLLKLQTRYIETRASLTEKGEEGNLYDILKKTWAESVPHTVLFAEGGMGKTVSVIRLWENLLNSPDQPVPLFIALNEYNSVKAESDKEKFLIKKIGRNYLGKESLTDQDENDLWAVLKTSSVEAGHYKPSFILFLDGFNELSGDKTKLLLELKELAATASGMQIVVTSRYDMRNFTWTSSFSFITLLPLSEKAIGDYFIYLAKEFGATISLPSGKHVRQLLANPFMLTLFTASSARVSHYQNNPIYDFKKKNNSYGELMWNFIESQVVKYYEGDDTDPAKSAYYRFLLRHFLPYLGFEMEMKNQFFLLEADLKKVIAGACTYFYRKEFIEAFSDYDEFIDGFDINLEEKSFSKSARRIAEILNELSEHMLMLVEEDEAYRFLHQHFRDYFSAVHILNDIRLSMNSNMLPEFLQQRVLPVPVRKAIGEIEGEQYNKPVFIPETKKWNRGEARESVLIKLLDQCRQLPGNTNTGFLVWNILTIWKELRGELTGEGLDGLDLRNFSFADLPCFRKIQDQYLSADFRRSVFEQDAFFLKGHSATINFIEVNKAGTKCLTASDDGKIKEWDLNTGVCLATAKCDDKVQVVRYSYDESIVMAGCKSGRLHILTTGLKERIGKINVGDGYPLWHISVNEKTMAISSYYRGVFLYNVNEVTSNQNKQWLEKMDEVDSVIVNLEWSNKTLRLLRVTSKAITEIGWENREICTCIYQQDGGQLIVAATYSSNGDEIIGITNDNLVLRWIVANKGGSYDAVSKSAIHTNVKNDVVFDPLKRKGIFIMEFNNSLLFHEAIEFDLETGKSLNTFRVNRDVISTITYLKVGEEVLIGTQAGFMYQYSTETGELIHTFQRTPGKILFSMFAVSGEKILCHSSNGVLHEFSWNGLTCINQVKLHDFYLTFAGYNNAGNLISVAGNGEIKCWERNTGRTILITTLAESPSQVQPVGDHFLALKYFSKDTRERRIDLLDMGTLETIPILRTNSHKLNILCAGTHAFFVRENLKRISNIYYCDVAFKTMQRIDTVEDAMVAQFAGGCNRDATCLYLGSHNGAIQLYQQQNKGWKKVKVFPGLGEPVSVNLIQGGAQLGIIRRKGNYDIIDIQTGALIEGDLLPLTGDDSIDIQSASFQLNGAIMVYQLKDVVYLYERNTKNLQNLALPIGPLVCNCNFQVATGFDAATTETLKQYGGVF